MKTEDLQLSSPRNFPTPRLKSEAFALSKKSSYLELFWSAFFPHFPAFVLNTERYFSPYVVRMRENAGKTPRITPNTSTFYAVLFRDKFSLFLYQSQFTDQVLLKEDNSVYFYDIVYSWNIYWGYPLIYEVFFSIKWLLIFQLRKNHKNKVMLLSCASSSHYENNGFTVKIRISAHIF